MWAERKTSTPQLRAAIINRLHKSTMAPKLSKARQFSGGNIFTCIDLNTSFALLRHQKHVISAQFTPYCCKWHAHQAQLPYSFSGGSSWKDHSNLYRLQRTFLTNSYNCSWQPGFQVGCWCMTPTVLSSALQSHRLPTAGLSKGQAADSAIRAKAQIDPGKVNREQHSSRSHTNMRSVDTPRVPSNGLTITSKLPLCKTSGQNCIRWENKVL